MLKKLKLGHTGQYYESRLKALSVNNDVYDVVVEDRGDSFVLYRNSGAPMRWARSTNVNARMSSYKAIISFEGQEILMEVKMRAHALWSFYCGVWQ